MPTEPLAPQPPETGEVVLYPDPGGSMPSSRSRSRGRVQRSSTGTHWTTIVQEGPDAGEEVVIVNEEASSDPGIPSTLTSHDGRRWHRSTKHQGVRPADS